MPKRCVGCMKIKNQSPICEHCGYNETIPNYPHQLPIGTVLRDQYVVGKVLGQGGFGITYIGWDQNLDVPIAIKEYFPNGFVNRECTRSLSVTCGDENRQLFQHNRERFIREAKALAKLREVPGIVRIHNFFQDNATAYIVMEYVEGIDLKRYIRMQGRPMTAAEILHILKPVMEALCKVHDAELVHRDITPDNIMIQPDGTAKLLDFGAVREVVDADADRNLSQATEAILKQGFAPMEQYQNRGSLGPWTDVYAICATMYYCLTGRVPPDAPARLLEGKELNWNTIPGLNPQQIQALEKGMAILPKDRTASIGELYTALYGTPRPQTGYQTGTGTSSYVNTQRPIQDYPNHTVPLEETPQPNFADITSGNAGGYSSYTAPKPAPAPKPKKKLTFPIFAAISLVAALSVFAFSKLDKQDSPALISTPAVQETRPVLQPSTNIDSVMAEGADYTYTYQNGSRLELYFDNNELERCRMYYNENDQLEYKFLAEYNEFGDVENHWVYDGKDNLIRQDSYTFDKDGDRQAYTLTDAKGRILEQSAYTYDKNKNLTKIVTKAGDGTVTRESTYTYDKQGNDESAVHHYKDGTKTESFYNENGKTEFQYNYDENGQLEMWWEYLFDANGERTGSIRYDGNGNVENTSEDIYNPDGNLVKTTNYTAGGALSYVNVYHYIAGDVRIGYDYQGSGNYKTENEYVNDILNSSVLQFGYTTSDYTNNYSISHYDNLGNQTEYLSYYLDGRPYSNSVYDYDEYGVFHGYTHTYYYDDGSFTTSEYNSNYDLLGDKSYDENGRLETWTECEFDAEGKTTEEITYRADGSLERSLEYTYNTDGTVYRRTNTYYYDDGTYTVSVSDADYNTLTSTGYKADGSVNYIYTYEYEFDSYGNKTKCYTYDKDGNLSYWTEYFYDENGVYLDCETHFD